MTSESGPNTNLITSYLGRRITSCFCLACFFKPIQWLSVPAWYPGWRRWRADLPETGGTPADAASGVSSKVLLKRYD